MSYKPIDCKRDQFRKYIESKGVIDSITKVLIKLLEAPVKPEHPLDFIRDNLGATLYEKNQIEQLEQQVKDYQQEVVDLKSQIEELKLRLGEKEKQSNASAISTDEIKSAAHQVVESNVTAAVDGIINEESASNVLGSGGVVDATVDKKIIESEKAVAPLSTIVDDAPVIEAAVAVNANTTDDKSANATSDKSNSMVTENTGDVEKVTTGGQQSEADSNTGNTVASADAAGTGTAGNANNSAVTSTSDVKK